MQVEAAERKGKLTTLTRLESRERVREPREQRLEDILEILRKDIPND